MTVEGSIIEGEDGYNGREDDEDGAEAGGATTSFEEFIKPDSQR